MGIPQPWPAREQYAQSGERQEVFRRVGNRLFLQSGEIDQKFWELQVLEDSSDIGAGYLQYAFLDVRNGRRGHITWSEGEVLLQEEGFEPALCTLLTYRPRQRCLVELHQFDLRQRPVMIFGREDLDVFVYASDSIHGASARDGSPLWASRLFFVGRLVDGSITELPCSELALGREYFSQSARHGTFYLFGPHGQKNSLWKTHGGQHIELYPLALSDYEVQHHERTGALLSFGAKS